MSNSNGGWDFSEYSSPSSAAGSGDGFGSQQGQARGFGSQQPFGGSPFTRSGQSGQSPLGGAFGQPDTDMFGTSNTDGGAPARLESVSAPTGWLFAAIGVALVAGIAASIFGGNLTVAISCWALAGPVTIGLFAVYLMKDVKARTHLNYSPPTWAPLLYAVGLVITFAAVMIASLQIAFWVGRL